MSDIDKQAYSVMLGSDAENELACIYFTRSYDEAVGFKSGFDMANTTGRETFILITGS